LWRSPTAGHLGDITPVDLCDFLDGVLGGIIRGALPQPGVRVGAARL
jgi:hypothetical protein